MSNTLMIEPERDENGYHAAIVDVSQGAVLHVTDSFPAVSDAVKVAQTWIQDNG